MGYNSNKTNNTKKKNNTKEHTTAKSTSEKNDSNITVARISANATKVVAIIGAVALLLSKVIEDIDFSSKSKENTENIENPNAENVDILYSNEETKREMYGVDYISCSITCNMDMSYQLKVYPYITIRVHDDYGLYPLCNLYSQTDYASNNEGACIAIKLDKMKTLEEDISNGLRKFTNDYSVKSDTIVIVRYYEGKEPIVEALELSTGKMSTATASDVYEVCKLHESTTATKLNVYMWDMLKEEYIATICADLMEKYN